MKTWIEMNWNKTWRFPIELIRGVFYLSKDSRTFLKHSRTYLKDSRTFLKDSGTFLKDSKKI